MFPPIHATRQETYPRLFSDPTPTTPEQSDTKQLQFDVILVKLTPQVTRPMLQHGVMFSSGFWNAVSRLVNFLATSCQAQGAFESCFKMSSSSRNGGIKCACKPRASLLYHGVPTVKFTCKGRLSNKSSVSRGMEYYLRTAWNHRSLAF